MVTPYYDPEQLADVRDAASMRRLVKAKRHVAAEVEISEYFIARIWVAIWHKAKTIRVPPGLFEGLRAVEFSLPEPLPALVHKAEPFDPDRLTDVLSFKIELARDGGRLLVIGEVTDAQAEQIDDWLTCQALDFLASVPIDPHTGQSKAGPWS